MRLTKKMRIAAGLAIIMVTGILFVTSCNGSNTQAPQIQSPPPQSTTPSSQVPSGSVTITAMITEVVGSNISLNTASGPLVLKFNSSSVVLRLDGSAGTTKELRPGMKVVVSYDPATNIIITIKVQ